MVYSEEDFVLFQSEFKKWQERFGLNDWQVYFKHEPIDGSFATIVTDLGGMIATVRLNNDLPEKDHPFKDVERTAKHEALHLLIGRLEWNGRARHASEAEICEAAESLVNRLEGLIS